MTLDQVKAAKPTADYEPRYGAPSGPWTTDDVHRGRDLQLAWRRPQAGSAGAPRGAGVRPPGPRATPGPCTPCPTRLVTFLRRLWLSAQPRLPSRGSRAAAAAPRLRPVPLRPSISPAPGAPHHRGLALADARAGKGRLCQRAVERCRRESGRQLGPGADAAAGEQCRGYGAPAVMRLPGRVRISWEGDTALKVETEAGSQTRLFTFGAQPQQPAGWQGTSAAFWQPAGGGGGRRGGGAPARGGSLRVVTTNLQARLSAPERRAIQRQRPADGVLQPRQRSQRRRLPGDHHAGRGPHRT